MPNNTVSLDTELTTPAAGDWLPIVDVSESSTANQNKKIKYSRLVQGIFNVQAYGAAGDGSTDDTAAIQAAIDAAEAAGGGVVQLPLGTYLVSSELTIEANRIVIQGEGSGTTIQSNATTGNVFEVKNPDATFQSIYITAVSPRTGASATVYSDATPMAGAHGIAFIPTDTSTSFYGHRLIDVWVSQQPDDGIAAQQPQHMYGEFLVLRNNGRFGLHVSGVQYSPSGSRNFFQNVRTTSNGSYGLLARATSHSVFVNCESAQNDGDRQIFVWGGRGNILIQPHAEHSTFNTGNGIRIVGSYHRIVGGSIHGYQTPIGFGTATACVLDHPYVTNGEVGTNADQVVLLDSASHDNQIFLSPLSRHTDVDALVTANQNATGNRLFLQKATRTVSSNYSVLLSDGTIIASGAGTTVTLPLNGQPGVEFTIKRVDAANAITVDCSGADTIDGAGSMSLDTNYAFITCVSDGANYHIVAQEGTVA